MAVQATLAWEEKEGGPRAQRGPVAGATSQFSLAPSIGVFGVVPVWARSIFSCRASSFVRGVWRLELGGAAAGGGAMRARAVCAACRAACARAVLPFGCGCCCGGVCAATLAASGARAVGGARAVVVQRARWVPRGGGVGFLSSPWAGRGTTALAVCVWPPCSCARDVVDVAAGVRRHGRSRLPRWLVHAHGVAGGTHGTAVRGAVAVLAWRWR